MIVYNKMIVTDAVSFVHLVGLAMEAGTLALETESLLCIPMASAFFGPFSVLINKSKTKRFNYHQVLDLQNF